MALRHGKFELVARRAGSRRRHPPALLLTELHRFVAPGVCPPSHGGGNRDILHQPNPLSDRLRPHLFVGPANLGGPIGCVIEALSFNPYRKRANNLAGANTVKRGPVISLAVHQAGGERITAYKPFGLSLSQVISLEIAAQS